MSIHLVKVQLTCQACGRDMHTYASVEEIRSACDALIATHTCVPGEVSTP